MSDTNSTELVFTRQTGYKSGIADPADFRICERSEISQFGNTYTKSEPSRVGKNRNPRQKRTTAIDSGVEFTGPLDIDSMLELGQGFMHAIPTGPTFAKVTAATSGALTVPALSSTQAAMFQSGKTIVAIKGLKNASNKANGGSFLVSGAVASGATSIPVAGVVAETLASNRRAAAYVAGVRGASGDIEIDADGNLTSTSLDFTTLGLVVDQAIYIGGRDDANGFSDEDNHGFAQILTITANKLTLYNRDRTFVADNGSGVQIDILFGPMLRNWAIGHTNYQRLFYTFGLSIECTMPVPKTTYEYAKDNACDSMSISLEDEFATVTFGFVGSQTTLPSVTAANGHENAAPLNTIAEFSTNVDLVQFAINKEDGTNLFTDFDDLTITFANGAAARKVKGTTIPGQINISKFRTTIDFSAIFSDSDVLEAIACDKALSLRFPLWNDDGGLYFHIPQLGFEGGDRSFPEDEQVTISTTGYAFNEDRDGSCMNITVFPLLPRKPCAIT